MSGRHDSKIFWVNDNVYGLHVYTHMTPIRHNPSNWRVCVATLLASAIDSCQGVGLMNLDQPSNAAMTAASTHTRPHST